MAKRLLFTGFEPFLSFPVNPSWDGLVSMLEQMPALSNDVAIGRIPVEYARAADVLADLLKEHQPEVLVCLGVHGGSESAGRGLQTFYVERYAYNLNDAKNPDATGQIVQNRPILSSMEPDQAMESTLDPALVHALFEAAGAQTAYSDNPGRYLCNHIYFSALHQSSQAARPLVNFVHVPPCSVSRPEALPIDEFGAILARVAEALLEKFPV